MTPRPTSVRRLAPLTLVALVALAACGDDGGEEELPSDTSAPVVDGLTVPTTSPPSIVARDDVTSVEGVEVGLEEVGRFEEPIAMATRPGTPDRVYLAERGGVVRDLSLADGSSEVVLDLSDRTTVEDERGLLGIAVDPDGTHLYVSSTNLDGDTRIEAYEVAEDGSVDTGSRRLVFALEQPFPNHNGGNIVFGPDGFLYLGLGDGGNAGDPLLAGQDRSRLLGSLLRIDPEGHEGSAYSVPGDNPYVGQEDARPEVWLKGVCNPWRFSFDRATGDLWIGDVGQYEVEEVDWLPADDDGTGAGRGTNLGWNEMEGDRPFEDGVEPEDHTPPIVAYDRDDGGCSVTGGYVYRGSALPDLFGAYLFTDYCLGELQALAVDRDGGELLDRGVVLPEPLLSPISFAEDAAGELYVLSQAGALSRLVPT